MVTEDAILKALDRPSKLHRLLAIVEPVGSADNLGALLMRMRERGMVRFESRRGCGAGSRACRSLPARPIPGPGHSTAWVKGPRGIKSFLSMVGTGSDLDREPDVWRPKAREALRRVYPPWRRRPRPFIEGRPFEAALAGRADHPSMLSYGRRGPWPISPSLRRSLRTPFSVPPFPTSSPSVPR